MMKRIVSLGLVLGFLLVFTGGVFNEVESARSSIVTMMGGDEWDNEAASGFVIAKENGATYVLTSYRMDEEYLDKIYYWQSETQKYNTVQILVLEEYGISVMKVLTEIKNTKPLIINNNPEINVGQHLSILAYEGMYYLEEDEHSVSTSLVRQENVLVSNVDTYEGVRVYEYDCTLGERSEGGAVLDDKGRVVGVNVYLGGETMYGSVNIADVIPYLESAGIPIKTGMPYSTRYLLTIVAVLILAAFAALMFVLNSGSRYQLAGLSGRFAGTVIGLKNENIVLGRDPAQCSLVYPSDTRGVSRRHCEIYYDKISKHYMLVDVSSEGTFINGSKMQKGKPYTLGQGVRFYLADKKQLFEIRKK